MRRRTPFEGETRVSGIGGALKAILRGERISGQRGTPDSLARVKPASVRRPSSGRPSILPFAADRVLAFAAGAPPVGPQDAARADAPPAEPRGAARAGDVPFVGAASARCVPLAVRASACHALPPVALYAGPGPGAPSGGPHGHLTLCRRRRRRRSLGMLGLRRRHGQRVLCRWSRVWQRLGTFCLWGGHGKSVFPRCRQGMLLRAGRC